MKSVRFSIKYKILFILVSIPLVSIASYFTLVSDLFEDDKKTYVSRQRSEKKHNALACFWWKIVQTHVHEIVNTTDICMNMSVLIISRY